jgi:hypothetical protein
MHFSNQGTDVGRLTSFSNCLLFNDMRDVFALDTAEMPLSLSNGKTIAISSAALLNDADLKRANGEAQMPFLTMR